MLLRLLASTEEVKDTQDAVNLEIQFSGSVANRLSYNIDEVRKRVKSIRIGRDSRAIDFRVLGGSIDSDGVGTI